MCTVSRKWLQTWRCRSVMTSCDLPIPLMYGDTPECAASLFSPGQSTKSGKISCFTDEVHSGECQIQDVFSPERARGIIHLGEGESIALSIRFKACRSTGSGGERHAVPVRTSRCPHPVRRMFPSTVKKLTQSVMHPG